MAKPLVAVVGRPNVGKSTFFNKMAGRRVSIVDDMPGVTRDRIYTDVEWCGYAFTLVDTGGIELKSEDSMWSHIRRQAELAIDIADVILFFVDGKSGLTSGDYDVADFLRRTRKPVVLAVNKVDGSDNSAIYDFYALDLGEPIPISAEQSLGLGDLLDEVVKHFDERAVAGEETESIKIAVVGKPNSGKSSLVNRILGFERVIVSNVAGTTRDAIDTPFEYEGKRYVIIDTAGIRKKRGFVAVCGKKFSVLIGQEDGRGSWIIVLRADVLQFVAEKEEKKQGSGIQSVGRNRIDQRKVPLRAGSRRQKNGRRRGIQPVRRVEKDGKILKNFRLSFKQKLKILFCIGTGCGIKNFAFLIIDDDIGEEGIYIFLGGKKADQTHPFHGIREWNVGTEPVQRELAADQAQPFQFALCG